MTIFLDKCDNNKGKVFQLGSSTWMWSTQGVGELESDYQGRSRDSSFLQETGKAIQYQPRIGSVPKMLLKVQDARKFLAHLPFLFFLISSVALAGPQAPRGQSINRHSPPSLTKMDQKLKHASDLYEQHFIREMVRAMRKTVHRGGLMKTSMGQKIYEQKLDEEYVQLWGKAGGVGLSQIIYDQLKEQMSPRRITFPKGPLPIKKKPQLHPVNKASSSPPLEPVQKNSCFPYSSPKWGKGRGRVTKNA